MMLRIYRSLNLLSKTLNSPKPIPIPPKPISILPSKSHIWTKFSNFSTTNDNNNEDYSNEIDEINLKFAEAREEIEAALESKETVYFNEEAECARNAVEVVLGKFDGLLEKLDENGKMKLRRSMGLKIEQLKAELMQLDDRSPNEQGLRWMLMLACSGVVPGWT